MLAVIAAVGASGAGAGRAQFCGGVPPERSTGRAARAEPAPARQQLALGRIVREPKFRTPLPCPTLPAPPNVAAAPVGADKPPPAALALGEVCYIPSWVAGQGSLVTAVLSNAVSGHLEAGQLQAS